MQKIIGAFCCVLGGLLLLSCISTMTKFAGQHGAVGSDAYNAGFSIGYIGAAIGMAAIGVWLFITGIKKLKI